MNAFQCKPDAAGKACRQASAMMSRAERVSAQATTNESAAASPHYQLLPTNYRQPTPSPVLRHSRFVIHSLFGFRDSSFSCRSRVGIFRHAFCRTLRKPRAQREFLRERRRSISTSNFIFPRAVTGSSESTRKAFTSRQRFGWKT